MNQSGFRKNSVRVIVTGSGTGMKFPSAPQLQGSVAIVDPPWRCVCLDVGLTFLYNRTVLQQNRFNAVPNRNWKKHWNRISGVLYD